MIQFQIHHTNITRIEEQTGRRITNEILAVKGLNREENRNLNSWRREHLIRSQKWRLKNIDSNPSCHQFCYHGSKNNLQLPFDKFFLVLTDKEWSILCVCAAKGSRGHQRTQLAMLSSGLPQWERLISLHPFPLNRNVRGKLARENKTKARLPWISEYDLPFPQFLNL